MAKELPILFTAEMVRAKREGRKSVFRRVCKIDNPGFYRDAILVANGAYRFNGYGTADFKFLKPRYQVGDHLWVRETWWDLGWMENGEWNGRLEAHTVGPRYCADCPDPYKEGIGGVIQPERIPWRKTHFLCSTWRKRPSIHMPKWAARKWLEVVSVRPEQLQDMTWNWRYEFKKVNHG